MTKIVRIANRGPDIAETDYWSSAHAEAGLCYLSGNAGTWRLLVPDTAESMLTEMRTGARALIEPSIRAPKRAWDIVFDDGTEAPFSLTVDKRQVDRAIGPSGTCRLTVWTRLGGRVLDLPCTVV